MNSHGQSALAVGGAGVDTPVVIFVKNAAVHSQGVPLGEDMKKPVLSRNALSIDATCLTLSLVKIFCRNPGNLFFEK
jgi:hypothetical protein